MSSIIKTLTTDSTIYFIVISVLTFYCLYKVLEKYSIFPVIGLCIYIARFMLGRNFMQIRAALAIALFLIGLEYITNKNIKKYALLSTASFSLHHSIIIALPLYLLTKISITKKHIIWGLLAAYSIALFLSEPIRDIVSNFSFTYEVATAYVREMSSYSFGKGVKNPMIYYQIAILLAFTFLEDKLKHNKHYYTFRNGYFYSTLIIILLSSYDVLSGRSATIFATLEIIIVPLIISGLPKKSQSIGAIGVGIIYSIIFYMNYQFLFR